MQHTTPRKTYYIKYRILVLPYTCISSAWIIWEIFFQQSNIDSIWLLVLNILVISSYQTRVVTSPSGISYHNSGLYSIHSTWQDIEKMDITKFRIFGSNRCLVLKNTQKLGWWTELAWGSSREERGRTIPIPANGSWNKLDDLIADIKKYAPDLTGIG